MIECLTCGKVIQGRSDKKFCDRTCQKKYQRTNPKKSPKRACPICLSPFSPTRKDKLTCSNACRQAFYRGNKKIPYQILSAGGNKRYAEIGVKYGFLHGAQFPCHVYFKNVFFADQNWKEPNFKNYLQGIQYYRPHMATVLDWEQIEQFEEVLFWAKTISPYVKKIIIIPKVIGKVHRIPHYINNRKVILGYSIPTSHGGTKVPIEEFQGWPVHLLGGSPEKQMDVWKENKSDLNIFSCDGNYIFRQARRNQFWSPYLISKARNKRWPQHNEVNGYQGLDAPYEAIRLSCQNIQETWQRLKNATNKTSCRNATFNDIDKIKEIADRNKNTLGFLCRGTFEESLTRNGDKLIYHPAGAFVRYHTRRDGWTTIYELCVDEPVRKMELGKTLMEIIPKPFSLKCMLNNTSNIFFERIGLIQKTTVQGKHCFLNIWQNSD